MQSLLQSKKLPDPAETFNFISSNGSDAETLAAAQLVTACRGEVSWGSREEDNSKIDIVLSCDHPWHKKERMIVLSQIKSGKTYGEPTSKGFKLKSSAIKAAKRTSHSICILWMNRKTNHAHWAYIHPNSNTKSQEYGTHHLVSPATLYDLARCMSKNIHGKCGGGKGVIIRQKNSNVTVRRKIVKKAYRDIKKLFSPVIGDIELTRLAWRHMFRSGRPSKYKKSSLDIIPYLPKIVKQTPSAHAITSSKEWTNNGYVYRAIEHLMKYSDIEISIKQPTEKKRSEAIIKVVEEIRYPKNWAANAMLSQHVDRRVVLKSAYYKC